MHSNRNVMFELECAWRYLSAGGVIVVDDAPAFDTFTKAHPEHPSLVCTAEPLSPGMRRFNHKGLFLVAENGGVLLIGGIMPLRQRLSVAAVSCVTSLRLPQLRCCG
jgi:hypothetical protein